MKSNVMRMVMGVIIIVVSVILMPIELTAVGNIIATTTTTTFTGLNDIAMILPLVILVLIMFTGGLISYGGYKGKGTSKGELMNVVYGMVTLFIGLTLFPIIMTTFDTMIVGAGSTYTGFSDVAAIMPLIILVAFAFGGGWLMMKGARGGGKGKKGAAEEI
jgi:hypothetical protein